jgi:hypothetical protein
VHNFQLTIPAQDSERPSIRIKPREVRSWLDNLPFLDLQRTTRLAREQLRLMNRQVIPAGARLEMLGDFLAIYQRLTEAMGGRASVDNRLQTVLKHLCQDIGFGYKIVAHELVNKRSLFIESRNLPLALLGAIHTLGLQLVDCYAGYRRAPRALWSECLALYGYAWQSGREKYLGPLPGFGEQQIDASFRLIALLRLADPYRLPAGMVMPLRRYFAPRIELCAIHGEPPPDSNCFFRLKDAFQPPPEDQDTNLYLDLDPLLGTMKTDIGRLAEYRQAQAIGLPPETAAPALLRALRQTLDHWQHHPTRSAERQETHARIDLVNGLSAAYCMVNHSRSFDPTLFVVPGQDQAIDLGARPAADHERSAAMVPVPFACTGINRSSGGLAVRYRGLQTPHPRVGQLLALRRPAPQSNAGWVVAVCRWLVEPEADNGFELGLQYLAREPRAVVIRVTDDSGHIGDYQAAIAATQRRGEQRVQTLITSAGEIPAGSLVTIFEQGRQQQVRCSEQLESGPGFERFIYMPV